LYGNASLSGRHASKTAGCSCVKNTDMKAKLAQALRLLTECGCTIGPELSQDTFLRVSMPKGIDRDTVEAICDDVAIEKQAVNGEEVTTLTPQQTEVLLRISAAKPNKQIAFELGISETTVKAHATNIYRRLDVRNRAEALLFTQR
jgi:DNA-binding NarL/FixJ family response regulator